MRHGDKNVWHGRTQKLKLLKILKIQIVTKLKIFISDKAQKLKLQQKSNSTKTQKLKKERSSKTKIVIKLENLNCTKTLTLL